MCSEKSRKSFYSIIPYSIPRYHDGAQCYIDFFQFDPVENRMRRKKYHLDKIRNKRERERRAHELVLALSDRLRGGWNVWTDKSSHENYTEVAVALSRYRYHIESVKKITALRNKTAYGYLSYLGIFERYLASRSMQLMYCCQLNVTFFSDFLDYVVASRHATARTRNNYRTWLSTMCQWMVEKSYLTENPIEKIKTLKEDVKKRDALTPQELLQLQKYLEENNPHFLLACLMEYYTFVRPGELAKVKIGDIRIKDQMLFVPAQNSKNRKDAMVGLNESVLRLMIDLSVFDHPSDYYLFGKDFRPTEQLCDSRIFREEFTKVRTALRWNDSKQFYSLKDSGIRDLSNAEGVVVARDQARHADITTTNKYLKQDSLTVHEETKKFKGYL